MLKLTQQTVEAYIKRSARSGEDPTTKSLVDQVSSLLFAADGLHDEADNLINLYMTVASHKTNELMSVLTVASAFFIPLTFIAGVYGMNFTNMPELQYENGYFICLGVMGSLAVFIYILFYTRGILPALWDPNVYPYIKDIPYLARRRSLKRNKRKKY